MTASFRPIESYISTPPDSNRYELRMFGEEPSADFLWFRLREYTDFPDVGMQLFSGTLAERRAKLQSFRAFVRQARTYWDAAAVTRGSASALPHYYAQLQLAKAELLLTYPAQIQAGSIMHGLRRLKSGTLSIRSDYLEVTKGVFPLLYEKRTGVPLPIGTRFRALNLLSLIPEVGLEVARLGPSRTPTLLGYHALALNAIEAWSVVMLPRDMAADPRERIDRVFSGRYEEVDQADFKDWRKVFALSTRTFGGPNVRLYQSKKTYSTASAGGIKQPNTQPALNELDSILGAHIGGAGRERLDFSLIPTIAKSSSLMLPIDLVRYAAIFYLSTLVRYAPAAIDPFGEPAQAYLMDSLTHETPVHLLIGSLDGIGGTRSYFDPTRRRL